MPGIPADFAKVWWESQKNPKVLSVVSSEHLAKYKEKNLPYQVFVAGPTQEARRIAVTQLEDIKCALFIQGGKYSTHEMKLFSDRGIPIVSFVGSGGAAGGSQPYEGWSYKDLENHPVISNKDPNADPDQIAIAISLKIINYMF